jgi:hypothetical protein
VGHDDLVTVEIDSNGGAIRDRIGEHGPANAHLDYTGVKPAQRPGTVDRVGPWAAIDRRAPSEISRLIRRSASRARSSLNINSTICSTRAS